LGCLSIKIDFIVSIILALEVIRATLGYGWGKYFKIPPCFNRFIFGSTKKSMSFSKADNLFFYSKLFNIEIEKLLMPVLPIFG
jgi:hypothetical protein